MAKKEKRPCDLESLSAPGYSVIVKQVCYSLSPLVTLSFVFLSGIGFYPSTHTIASTQGLKTPTQPDHPTAFLFQWQLGRQGVHVNVLHYRPEQTPPPSPLPPSATPHPNHPFQPSSILRSTCTVLSKGVRAGRLKRLPHLYCTKVKKIEKPPTSSKA